MEHHAAVRIPWEADTVVEGYYGRDAVQGASDEHAFGIVRISPGSEARGRTLLFAVQHLSGRCHAKRGLRHPGHDIHPNSPIPWLRG